MDLLLLFADASVLLAVLLQAVGRVRVMPPPSTEMALAQILAAVKTNGEAVAAQGTQLLALVQAQTIAAAAHNLELRQEHRLARAVQANMLFLLDDIHLKEIQMANALDAFIPAMQAQVTKLTADVAAIQSVGDAAVAAINGLNAISAAQLQQIKDLTALVAAGGVTPEQQALLDKMVSDTAASNAAVEAETASLAAAVVTVTPPSA